MSPSEPAWLSLAVVLLCHSKRLRLAICGPLSRYRHPCRAVEGGQPATEGPLMAGELLTGGFFGALTLSGSAWRDPHLHWIIQGKNQTFGVCLKKINEHIDELS